MIRPVSEIEYPPSEALCTKARMIARMEALSSSSNDLMSVIAQRIGAEAMEAHTEINALSHEQERLIENMRKLVAV